MAFWLREFVIGCWAWQKFKGSGNGCLLLTSVLLIFLLKFSRLAPQGESVSARLALGLFGFLAALGLGLESANAKDHETIFHSCNMSFHATGHSAYLGIGFSELNGTGTISCADLVHGGTVELPIRVQARGPGLGLGVTGLVLSGGVAGLGVSRGPESLMGHYLMVRANAAAGIGAGAGAAAHFSNGSATIDVSAHAESGLGVGVDLLWIDIQPLHDKDEDRGGEVAVAVPAAVEAAPVAPVETAPVVAAPVAAPAEVVAPAQVTALPVVAAAPAVVQRPVVVAPAKVTSRFAQIKEGQPIQLVDSQGRVIEILVLRRSH